MSEALEVRAVELMTTLLGKEAGRRLKRMPSLVTLRETCVSDLRLEYGLSDRAVSKALALVEFSRLLEREPVEPGTILSSPADVYRHARAIGLVDLPMEQFHVLLLDSRNRLIGSALASQGILTATLVHPREVFCPAIRAKAAALIVVHNHPSGDPTPSRDDEEVTRRLGDAGALIGITMLDHVVVGRERYISMREGGWKSSSGAVIT